MQDFYLIACYTGKIKIRNHRRLRKVIPEYGQTSDKAAACRNNIKFIMIIIISYFGSPSK